MKSKKFIALTALFASSVNAAIPSPENESARLSRVLKGIPDQQWSSIAGEKTGDLYEITKGDTLYGISGRLFGDSKYWPKIWEINNLGILNPHMIRPGRSITFNSGDGNTLPSVGVSKKGSSSMNGIMNDGRSTLIAKNGRMMYDPNEKPGPTWDEKTPKPSDEWKKLPRQSWEQVGSELPPTADKTGLDRRSLVRRKRNTGFELDSTMACKEIIPLATINGSRGESEHFMLGDEILLSSNGPALQTDQVYSIISSHSTLEREDGQKGFVYPIEGKVKIIGVHDGQYLGEIVALKGLGARGMGIIDTPPKIMPIDPITGPSNLQGNIIFDRRSSLFLSAQHRWVYVNRGSADGVQPGMIFRMFQYKDPVTKKTLTAGNVLVEGDVEVYQTCENFSIAQVAWSRGTIENNNEAILLTDLNDRFIRYYLNGSGEGTSPPPSGDSAPSVSGDFDDDLEVPKNPELPPSPDDSDWLDQLDNNQDLAPDEEKELEQLEKYEGAPEDAPAPLDETAPTETEGAATLDPSTSELPAPPPETLTEPTPLEAPTEMPAESNSDFESEELAPVQVPEAPSSSTPQKPSPSPSPSGLPEDEDQPL
jgi:hypothetical protein